MSRAPLHRYNNELMIAPPHDPSDILAEVLMQQRETKTLWPPEVVRTGHFSDQYFNNAQELLISEKRSVNVLMQIFQKNDSYLGGMRRAQEALKLGAGYKGRLDWIPGWPWITVKALDEGSPIEPNIPVMTIYGPYHFFAHMETVVLGMLARGTLIRTNIEKVKAVANDKPLFFFPARHDTYEVQIGDGYVAWHAGMKVCSPAQAAASGAVSDGSMPHSLIAAFGGDTVAATLAFARKFHSKMNIISLVDFENDCARTAVEVANAMKAEELPLWGVRLDTSEKLVDEGVRQICPPGVNIASGVTTMLVGHVRRSLDEAGHQDVKIVVSGGFNATKIAEFERQGARVDAYGIGSSLLRGQNDFTADIVMVEGKPCAKVGRELVPNPSLKEVRL